MIFFRWIIKIYFINFSYNFIYTLWDLSHRDDLEFPEMRENYVFERREERYSKILPKATAILVDSNLGKENVIRRYNVDSERVLVMPFSPAENILLGAYLFTLACFFSSAGKLVQDYSELRSYRSSDLKRWEGWTHNKFCIDFWFNSQLTSLMIVYYRIINMFSRKLHH